MIVNTLNDLPIFDILNSVHIRNLATYISITLSQTQPYDILCKAGRPRGKSTISDYIFLVYPLYSQSIYLMCLYIKVNTKKDTSRIVCTTFVYFLCYVHFLKLVTNSVVISGEMTAQSLNVMLYEEFVLLRCIR